MLALSDLQTQRLTDDKIYNIWCDKMAGEAWQSRFPPQDDPEVYSKEQWAVYSQYSSFHNITGDLTQGICSTLGFSALSSYISQKHAITPEKLQRINLQALHGYLSWQKEYKRATICKTIHNWIPTYSTLCRQG